MTKGPNDPSPSLRDIWMSDWHLGAKKADPVAIVDFLESHPCARLNLLGDIFDGWKLNRRWHWPTEYCVLWDTIFALQAAGTRVQMFSGNHDDRFEQLSDHEKHKFQEIFGIPILERAIHTSQTGKKFLVFHGHQFDGFILRSPFGRLIDWMEHHVTDHAPQPLMITVHGHKERFSLRKYLRGSGEHAKRAMLAIKRLKRLIHAMAHRNNVQGVICGHTHVAGIEDIGDITYANSGCWKRSKHTQDHTALAEDENGQLTLIHWPCKHNTHPLAEKSPIDWAQHHPLTRQLHDYVHDLYGKIQP